MPSRPGEGGGRQDVDQVEQDGVATVACDRAASKSAVKFNTSGQLVDTSFAVEQGRLWLQR